MSPARLTVTEQVRLLTVMLHIATVLNIVQATVFITVGVWGIVADRPVGPLGLVAAFVAVPAGHIIARYHAELTERIYTVPHFGSVDSEAVPTGTFAPPEDVIDLG